MVTLGLLHRVELPAQVDIRRTLMIDLVERHGGADELAARRSRSSDPS